MLANGGVYVAVKMKVVLIEFGVVFIGGWGYLTQVKQCFLVCSPGSVR